MPKSVESETQINSAPVQILILESLQRAWKRESEEETEKRSRAKKKEKKTTQRKRKKRTRTQNGNNGEITHSQLEKKDYFTFRLVCLNFF